MAFQDRTQVDVVATAAPINATGLDLKQAKGFWLTHEVSVTTPAAQTFTVDVATNTLAIPSHGMLTGLKVQVSAATTLAAPLAAATDYFVIYVDANTIKLATTLSDAQAGTAIVITTAGTGTQTITPTALAGASFKLQASVDNVTYFDLGISNSVTVSANFLYEKVDPMYNWLRCVYTLTAGQISVIQTANVKNS